MQDRFKIWYAFLGGALGWTLHLMGSYALSEGFCRSGLHTFAFLGLSVMLWSLAILTLLSLAVTLGALWLSRRQQVVDAVSPHDDLSEIQQFMNRSSFLNNILFLVVIVAQTFPLLILGASCS